MIYAQFDGKFFHFLSHIFYWKPDFFKKFPMYIYTCAISLKIMQSDFIFGDFL